MIIPIEKNKKLADYQIELIREKLNLLSWVGSSYPAVKVGVRENGDTYPQVYAQAKKRKILDLTPSSAEKSYCFFEKRGFEGLESENTYKLSVVFWGQLNAINASIEYDYTSTLISDVLEILRAKSCLNIEVTEENTFEKYNLHESKKQFFMYPYFSFKIDFEITANNNC